MNFKGFSVVEFPPVNPKVSGFVYVLCWVAGSDEVPFYVGQTTRIWGRLDDYYWAMHSACTDFRVGEAVRYLGARGYHTIVKYKSSSDPRHEESEIIKHLRSLGRNLLNDLSAYDYKKEPDESKHRLRVQNFVADKLLSVSITSQS